MQVLASSLIGREIFELQTGSRNWQVQSIIIDPASLKLKFFVLKKHKNSNLAYLQISGVREINSDCIIVDSEESLAEAGDLVRYSEILSSPIYLVSYSVRTQSGKKLGTCRDYCLDLLNLEVVKLFVTGRLAQKLLISQQIIAAGDVVRIEKKLIIVRDATIPVKEAQKTALPVNTA